MMNFAGIILDFFRLESSPDPVVRLFQIEFAKEYKMLMDNGVEIDRALALEHINR